MQNQYITERLAAEHQRQLLQEARTAQLIPPNRLDPHS